MKKILIVSLGLVAVLSAGACPDNNRFYTIAYTSVSEKLKELESNSDGSAFNRTFISAYARTKCDIKCKIAAASKDSDEWSDKKYSSCYNTCMQGAQDAYSGTKPKMKLCEEEKK